MSTKLSDPLMEFKYTNTNASNFDDPIMEFSRRQKDKLIVDDPIMDFAIKKEVESFKEYGERGLREFDKKIANLRKVDTNLLAADWMGANWRDIKEIPEVVTGGAAKGGAGLLDTAAWFSDRFVEMHQPGKLIKIARQQNLQDKIKSGEKTIDSLTEDERNLLAWDRGGMSGDIREKVTAPVEKFGQKLIDESDMNPLGKAYFGTVGEMIPNFVPMSMAVKGLGTVKGLALYNALQAMPQEDIKQVLLAAGKGAVMGKISQIAEVIKPKFLRALAEGTGDMSASVAEKAIRTGKIDIGNEQLADMFTGFAMAYGMGKGKGKGGDVEAGVKAQDVHKQDAQPDLDIRYEEIPRNQAEKSEGASQDTVIYPKQDTVVLPSQDTVIYPADQPARFRGREEPSAVSDPIMEFANRKKTVSQDTVAYPEDPSMRFRDTGESTELSDPIMEFSDRSSPKQELYESHYDARIDDSMTLKPPPGEAAPGGLPEEGISRYRTNTMEKSLPEKVLELTPEENYRYQKESLPDWHNEAKRRLDIDFEGEKNRLLQKEALTEGTDGGMIAEINRRLIDQGKYQEVADFTRAITPKITATAKGLRSIAIAKNLSQDGILLTAQRIYNEAKAEATKGGRKTPEEFDSWVNKRLKGEFLSPEFTREITGQARKIEQMPEGNVKDKQYRKLLKKIRDRIPRSLWQKVESLQTMSLLLNFKTIGRNILGNTSFATIDSISKNIFGVPIDLALSRFTDKRTVAYTTPKEISESLLAGLEGLKRGTQDIKSGMNTRMLDIQERLGPEGIEWVKKRGQPIETDSKYEIRTDTFKAPFFKALEKLTGITLVATDYAFYERAFRSSLYNEMKAAKVTQATPEMLFNAHYNGLYQTFQHKTRMSTAGRGIKKVLNKWSIGTEEWGLGSLIMKFPKTPGNLLSIGLFDYSPLGYIKGILKVADVVKNKGKGKYTQREAALGMSRASMGTAIWWAGYQLFKAGILYLKEDKDKARDLQSATGTRGLSLNWSGLKRWIGSGFNNEVTKWRPGDKDLPYDWAEPFAVPFSMGAQYAKIMQEMPDASPARKIANGIIYGALAGAKTASEQPYYTGLYELFRGGDIAEGTLKVIQGAPSTFVPTLAAQVRYLIDPKIRDKRTVDRDILIEACNEIMDRVPGLSYFLPEQIDITGKSRKRYQSGSEIQDFLNIFITPWNPSEYQASPGMQMVRALYEKTGDTGVIPKNVTKERKKSYKIRGVDVVLTTEQKIRYQQLLGQEVQEYLDKMATNVSFQNKPPDRQAAYIKKYLNRIGNRILRRFKAEMAGGQR